MPELSHRGHRLDRERLENRHRHGAPLVAHGNGEELPLEVGRVAPHEREQLRPRPAELARGQGHPALAEERLHLAAHRAEIERRAHQRVIEIEDADARGHPVRLADPTTADEGTPGGGTRGGESGERGNGG
jgi:hypothetical protein